MTTLDAIAAVRPALGQRRAPGAGIGTAAPSPPQRAGRQRAGRRVSPAVYKASLATHIVVSAGWLGVALAKLVLGVVAVTSGAPGAAASLYAAMDAVNIAFPPLAVATFISGVALSLGTRWGLLRHVWVVTKLVLTVGVIVTAVQIGGRVQPALGALSRSAAEDGALLGLSAAPVALVLALGLAHVIMLGAAVVLSVYKPGGRTWLGRRGDAAPPS